MSRRDLVKQLLEDNPNGVTTSQFLRAGAGSRYGARVQELRDQGFVITCSRVRDGEFKYVLDAEGGGESEPGTASLSVSPEPASAIPLNAEPLSTEGQLFELPPPRPARYADPEAA